MVPHAVILESPLFPPLYRFPAGESVGVHISGTLWLFCPGVEGIVCYTGEVF